MIVDFDIFNDFENSQTFYPPSQCSSNTVCIDAPSCVDAIILVKSFLYANCIETTKISRILHFLEYYFCNSISSERPVCYIFVYC